jgi:hypothetical protein
VQLRVYQNSKRRDQTTTRPACCDKTSASSRRSQGSDAAAAPAQRPGATLISVAFKNQSPWKLLLWLLRAASRVRKRHCVVLKKQGFTHSLANTTCLSYVIKCCPNPGSRISSLYWSLAEEWFEPSQAVKTRGDMSRKRIGQKKGPPLREAASTYSQASVLKWAETPSCMSHIIRRTCCGIFSCNSGGECFKKSKQ